MRLLHLIRARGQAAWIWGTVLGANGRYLSTRNHDRWSPIYHAYPIERQRMTERIRLSTLARDEDIAFQADTGMARVRQRRTQRRWWSPWSAFPRGEECLQPLCGRLNSRSQRPRFEISYHTPQGDTCPDCQRIATERGINIQRHAEVQQHDPWALVDHTARETTPDPITGD